MKYFSELLNLITEDTPINSNFVNLIKMRIEIFNRDFNEMNLTENKLEYLESFYNILKGYIICLKDLGIIGDERYYNCLSTSYNSCNIDIYRYRAKISKNK